LFPDASEINNAEREAHAHPGVRGVEPPRRRRQRHMAGGHDPVLRPRHAAESSAQQDGTPTNHNNYFLSIINGSGFHDALACRLSIEWEMLVV